MMRRASERPFTAAQLQVVKLVADGRTYAEIAEIRGCAVRTVRALVEQAALRIPGDEPQRYRLQRWWRKHRCAA